MSSALTVGCQYCGRVVSAMPQHICVRHMAEKALARLAGNNTMEQRDQIVDTAVAAGEVFTWLVVFKDDYDMCARLRLAFRPNVVSVDFDRQNLIHLIETAKLVIERCRENNARELAQIFLNFASSATTEKFDQTFELKELARKKMEELVGPPGLFTGAELLKQLGYPSGSPGFTVSVRVPGGGDWSNTDLEIDEQTLLSIRRNREKP